MFYCHIRSYVSWLNHVIQDMLQFSLANCVELFMQVRDGVFVQHNLRLADKLVDINYSNKGLEWDSGLKLTQTFTHVFLMFLLKLKRVLMVYFTEVNVLNMYGIRDDELPTAVISCVQYLLSILPSGMLYLFMIIIIYDYYYYYYCYYYHHYYWTLSIFLIKRKCIFGGENKVAEYCLADTLRIVYSAAGIRPVVSIL